MCAVVVITRHATAIYASAEPGTVWRLRSSDDSTWRMRSRHCALALVNSSVVMLAGWDGFQKRSDVWATSTAGRDWTRLRAVAPFSPRHDMCCVSTGGEEVLVIGGFDSLPRGDVWRSSDSGAAWVQLHASSGRGGALTPRSGHACAVVGNGAIVVTGGSTTPNMRCGTQLEDAWLSADGGASWELLSPRAPWRARSRHAMAAMPNGTLVLTGGWRGSEAMADVWASTDRGRTWTQLTHTPLWAQRASHGLVALPGNALVLVGGENAQGVLSDVWLSEDGGRSWVQQDTPAWVPRSGDALVAIPGGNSSLLLTGGQSNVSLLSDAWSVDVLARAGGGVALGEWQRVWDAAPLPRRFASVLWLSAPASVDGGGGGEEGSVGGAADDGEMLLLGGEVQGAALALSAEVWVSGTRGRTWSVRRRAAEFGARLGHCAVSVAGSGGGTVVLLLGGLTHTGLSADAWSSADRGETWTEESAPQWSPRAFHACEALENGTVVLVGGLTQGGASIDVWVGSAGDEWHSVPQTLGASPPARYQHAMVAVPLRLVGSGTGERLLVLGGHSTAPGTDLADVWSSDDGGQSWSGTAAPWPARRGMAAALVPRAGGSGAAVVLAGGCTGAVALSDVWRSDDAGGTWEQLSSAAAWAARRGGDMAASSAGWLLLMGGWHEPTQAMVPAAAWVSEDAGETWHSSPAMPWPARSQHAVALITPSRNSSRDDSSSNGDSDTSLMVVLAGRGDGSLALQDTDSSDGVSNVITNSGDVDRGDASAPLLADVWVSADSGYEWRPVTHRAPWTPRRATALLTLPSRRGLLLLGGCSTSHSLGGVLADVWRADASAANWTEVWPPPPWPARAGHAAVVMPDDTVLVMGGVGGGGALLADVWAASASALVSGGGAAWTLATAGAQWSPRGFAAAVALGPAPGTVLLVGGDDGSDLLCGDVWRGTAGGSALAARRTLRALAAARRARRGRDACSGCGAWGIGGAAGRPRGGRLRGGCMGVGRPRRHVESAACHHAVARAVGHGSAGAGVGRAALAGRAHQRGQHSGGVGGHVLAWPLADAGNGMRAVPARHLCA